MAQRSLQLSASLTQRLQSVHTVIAVVPVVGPLLIRSLAATRRHTYLVFKAHAGESCCAHFALTALDGSNLQAHDSNVVLRKPVDVDTLCGVVVEAIRQRRDGVS